MVERRTSRRELLAAVGATVPVAATAGCLTGGNDGGDSTAAGDDGGAGTTASTADGSTNVFGGRSTGAARRR
jgi:hypothetical protein